MSDPVREAIVARLIAITDIGIVHSYQRYAAREADLKNFYVYNGQLRGWFVRRLSLTEKAVNSRVNLVHTKWLIRGYMAVEDVNASELAFDSLLDDIRAAFSVEWVGHDLDGSISLAKIGEPVGVNIEDSGPVIFSGVLCHSAKCTLITRAHKAFPNRL